MSRLLRMITRAALEDVADGRSHKEIEYEFYARIVNLQELLDKAASKEEQEQWEIKIERTDKNVAGGRIRVRKIIQAEGMNPEYVLTTKIKLNDGSDLENSLPATDDLFLMFKYMSPGGMIKDRFVFPVEGTDMKFEFDLFKKPEGGYYEWCKIDLETDAHGVAVPPFPIELADIITNQEGERTEAEEAKIRSLYAYEFITPNQYLR